MKVDSIPPVKVGSIQELDHYISEPILTLDHPVASWFLLPFSSLFHPKMIWIPILTIYYMSGKSVLDAAYYGFGMVVTLLVSTLLKRRLKRERPLLRDKVKKFKHFRMKEKNFSIPSGDTVQAVLFGVFASECYGMNWGMSLGLMVLVAISRVYFMCHWVGDTLFAFLIEFPVALGLVSLKEPAIRMVQHLFQK